MLLTKGSIAAETCEESCCSRKAPKLATSGVTSAASSAGRGPGTTACAIPGPAGATGADCCEDSSLLTLLLGEPEGEGGGVQMSTSTAVILSASLL